MIDYQNTALVRFLQNEEPAYASKLAEVREAAEDWLAYVPETFPHYTRHTVRHSDEVVVQASDILFNDAAEPSVDLSPLEAFVIAAAAYLHDSGMVASTEAKRQILASNEWARWIAPGEPGHKRFAAIAEAWEEADASNGVKRFVADVELRRLISDFVRRVHHRRSAAFVTQQQSALGRFAFDDPLLTRTVADVCEAHGLSAIELDDAQRFPFRRNIRGSVVNVRFAAFILRLADLLDLSSARACPLIMNAANPLPPDSVPHWTQYLRITQRATSPRVVEVVAECETQEEHRVLQDWFSWIDAEVGLARRLLAGTDRHAGWVPPIATAEGPERTLRVNRAPDATYLPVTWSFRLDSDAVFERLIYDVYTSPLSFVRELLQNALDATRCRVVSEAVASGKSVASATEVDDFVREGYPVEVSLEESRRANPLTGEEERVHVLRVKDRGIGMTRDIVHDFLLQVGRSFYTTPQFREEYAFVPTSRYGIGFLSVFGASDHVVVRTRMAGAPGLQLTLTGPRNYLLVEEFDSGDSGTEVEVVLRQQHEQGELFNALTAWCRRVEFPIRVADFDSTKLLRAETAAEFEYAYPDVTEEGVVLGVRAFPISKLGIHGEVYVFFRRHSNGWESWSDSSWAQYTYPNLHPAAQQPVMPESLVCLNGLAVEARRLFGYRAGAAARVDFRKLIPGLSLSRELSRHARRFFLDELRSVWEEILSGHLNQASVGAWEYRNRLADEFSFLGSFWQVAEHMIQINIAGDVEFWSVEQLASEISLRVVQNGVDATGDDAASSPTLQRSVLERLARVVQHGLFEGRELQSVATAGDGWVATTWTPGPSGLLFWRSEVTDVYVGPAGFEDGRPGIFLHTTGGSLSHAYLLDSEHRVVVWLRKLRVACEGNVEGLSEDTWVRALELLVASLRHYPYQWSRFTRFLDQWRSLSLPAELRPPTDLPTEEELYAREITHEGRPRR